MQSNVAGDRSAGDVPRYIFADCVQNIINEPSIQCAASEMPSVRNSTRSTAPSSPSHGLRWRNQDHGPKI